MSKPAAPSQPPNFLRNMMLIMLVVMGVQLYMASQQKPANPQNADQIYATLWDQNKKLYDKDIVQTASKYKAALNDLVNAKKLTKAEQSAREIQATILVADTQLKAGLNGTDGGHTGRVRDAFNTLAGYERSHLGTPEWSTKYSVPDVTTDPRYGWNAWSGQDIYNKVRNTLEARNRTDLVWGMFPGYQIIDSLVAVTGRNPAFSYAFAAFLLALIVRAVIFPLSQRQIMYGRQMSQLTPLVMEIKNQYKDDQMLQNQKVMELYKEYGVNPMAGCGPMLLQMPLFFTIYQCMLRYQFTFERGNFLWINEATSRATHGLVAANLGQPDAILTIIYGITMVTSTLLTPVTDPTQVKQQRIMGIGVSVMMTVFMFIGAVPIVSAFVLYWTFTNILATIQSLRAYRLPLPALEKVNTRTGGTPPKGGFGGKWVQQFMEEAQRQEQTRREGTGNGFANGSANRDNKLTFLGTGETKTGAPAKHKPKKRK